jgi:hypothetical protein
MRLLTLGVVLVKERIADIYGRKAVRRFLEFDGADYRWEGGLLDIRLLGGQHHGAVLVGATPYMRIAADANFSNKMLMSENISGGLGNAVRRTITYSFRTYEEVEAPKDTSMVEFAEAEFSVVAISARLASARSASRSSIPSSGDISNEGRIFIPNAWPFLLF